MNNDEGRKTGGASTTTALDGRVLRKHNINTFANLKVPEPIEQVSYKPASDEQLAKAAKKKKGPSKAPTPTAAMTARNLFLIDFHTEHRDDATADKFTKAWKGISKDKLKEYEDRAKAKKIEAKAAAKIPATAS